MSFLLTSPVLNPLIIGGAGASIPEVTLLASIFRPRLVGAFIITVLSIAIMTGYIFNILF